MSKNKKKAAESTATLKLDAKEVAKTACPFLTHQQRAQ